MPVNQPISVNLSDWISFVSQMLSSVMALVGVFVGAYIANKASVKRHRLDALRSAYANVCRCYMDWVPARDVDHLMPLLAAIYEARLLSGTDVDASLQKLADAVTRSNPSKDVCGKCLQEFWERAQKEIRKGYGK